jgi:hypothetical protein
LTNVKQSWIPINGDSDNGDEVNDEKDQDGVPFSSVAVTLAVKNPTNVDFEDGVEGEKISDLMDSNYGSMICAWCQ